MSRTNCTFLALALTFGAHATAADFQLKGNSLGMNPTAACKGAEVTDNFGGVIQKHREAAPQLRDMNVNECAPVIETFGGYEPTAPAHLLFMDGRLILMKLEIDSLPLSAAADILTALRQEYGKARLTRSEPFITHTWKKGSSVLLVENTSRSWDENDLIVILRDEAAYKVFEKRSEHNRKQLQALDERNTKSDITK